MDTEELARKYHDNPEQSDRFLKELEKTDPETALRLRGALIALAYDRWIPLGSTRRIVMMLEFLIIISLAWTIDWRLILLLVLLLLQSPKIGVSILKFIGSQKNKR